MKTSQFRKYTFMKNCFAHKTAANSLAKQVPPSFFLQDIYHQNAVSPHEVNSEYYTYF